MPWHRVGCLSSEGKTATNGWKLKRGGFSCILIFLRTRFREIMTSHYEYYRWEYESSSFWHQSPFVEILSWGVKGCNFEVSCIWQATAELEGGGECGGLEPSFSGSWPRTWLQPQVTRWLRQKELLMSFLLLSITKGLRKAQLCHYAVWSWSSCFLSLGFYKVFL